MATGEYGQIESETESIDFNEAVHMKNEPCEIDIFAKCSSHHNIFSSRADFVDRKTVIDSYQEQNEVKCNVKNENADDLGHFKFSHNAWTTECNTVQIKSEDDINIHHEDVKREIDSILQPFVEEEEMVSEDEVIKEQHLPQRLSEPLIKDVSKMNDMAGKEFICKFCSKSLTSMQYLKIDEISHTGENSFNCKSSFHCKICLKLFTRSSNLKEHGKMHTGNFEMASGEYKKVKNQRESESMAFNEVFDRSRVKCEPCQIGISSERDIMGHKNASSKDEEQTDEYGAVELNTEHVDFTDLSTKCKAEQIKYGNHIDIHYEDVKTEFVENNKGECGLSEVCEEGFQTGDKPFRCKICSKSFIEISHLKIHEKVHTGKKQFHCKVCSKAFTKLSNLKIHEMIHTGEKPFHCQICSKAFSQLGRLKSHQKIHTGEKSFHCMVCSRAFTELGNLKSHERIHTGDKPFHCKICSKTFTTSNDLKRHGRIHTEERPFHCKICSKAFSQSGDLKVHERIHTGEKPYHCKSCSKAFADSSNLKSHERIHTGEKPFHCRNCSKSFRQKVQLTVHKMTHAGEKPFHCKICSKAFTRLGSLKTHERIHAGEKPFQCQICSKAFSQSGELKSHQKIHAGEKSFHCKICFKTFTTSTALKGHESIHTEEKSFHC